TGFHRRRTCDAPRTCPDRHWRTVAAIRTQEWRARLGEVPGRLRGTHANGRMSIEQRRFFDYRSADVRSATSRMMMRSPFMTDDQIRCVPRTGSASFLLAWPE